MNGNNGEKVEDRLRTIQMINALRGYKHHHGKLVSFVSPTFQSGSRGEENIRIPMVKV